MEEENTTSNPLKEDNLENTEATEPLKDSFDSNLDKELDLYIGTYEEAPKFFQDNEYIKGGYLLNCNTFKRIFRSLLIIHNESVNVWSHLIGAIFFFFLIWYTIIFITNLQTQISNIRSDASSVANKAKELREEYPDIMKNIYNSMKEIELNFKYFNDETKVYQRSFDNINYVYDQLKNYSNYTIPTKIESFIKTIKEYYQYFINAVNSLKEEIIIRRIT